MSTIPKSDHSNDHSKVAAVRKAWIEAVISEDVNKLASLVTDDFVAVHGNGQCSCGKDEFRKDLTHILLKVDVERVSPSSEIIVHDAWAIEIDEVESTRAHIADVTPIITSFKAVFVFKRQPDNSWKIFRILELLG
jgi:ketosteroid isomerase-like protein